MDIIGRSLSAAAVIAVIILMRQVMFKKISKRVLSALWLIAAAKLLLPFAETAIVGTISSDTAVSEIAYSAVPAASAAPTVPILHNAIVNVAVSVPAFESGFFILKYIWLFGAVFVSAFFVLSHINSRKIFSCALPADYDISSLKRDFRIMRPVRLLVSDRTDTPLTYGIFAPVVILPKSMDTDDDGLRNVLCHELAHIKRLDALFKTIIALCTAVHWFNPLVWAMFVLANRDIELACDETALRRGKVVPEDYAMTLIRVEESRGCSFERKFPLMGSFAGGKLEERIRGVMTKRKSALAGLLSAAVSAAAAAALNVIVIPYMSYETASYDMSMSVPGLSAVEASEYSEITAVYDDSVTDDIPAGYYYFEFNDYDTAEYSDMIVEQAVYADYPYVEIAEADYMVSVTEVVPAVEEGAAMISVTANEPPQGNYIIVYDFPTFAYAYTTTERGGIDSDTVVVVKIADDGSEISKQTRITPMLR